MLFALSVILFAFSIMVNAQNLSTTTVTSIFTDVTVVVEPSPTITDSLTIDLAALPSSVSSKIFDDLQSYQMSLDSQPEFYYAMNAIFNVIPAEELSSIIANPTQWAGHRADATATAAWFSAVPSPYRDYLVSVINAKESIIMEDLTVASTTVAATPAGIKTSTTTVPLSTSPTSSDSTTSTTITISYDDTASPSSDSVSPTTTAASDVATNSAPSNTPDGTLTSTQIVTSLSLASAPTERPAARLAGLVAAAGAFGLAMI